ncbi:Pkinase-domain-containing protein [Fomitiporia mediterranea MF3/22]|uniref:Pkinase-domain-containing protein n=1 Tax=Fomitiporia mediterranea (strain MF3/22) TaxID=694068 RepID=UPI0004407388|nr:Pkinase-domain-containing protein [Fomitiporia mediterranea MF3/22]EJD04239.1 Pkinase-domain-containing protein [Fomitiporia mediterranea MF3/22]
MQQQVGTQGLSGPETPSTGSPDGSISDGESWPPSAASTRANSRANSRAPSFSHARPGSEGDPRSRKPSFSSKSVEKEGKVDGYVTTALPLRDQPPIRTDSATPTRPKTISRPPSLHSDSGHKFQLKDLLAATPKLNRKSSARSSASSKKSDSDGDRRSTAGDSTASLSKKYGVCERLAIGKGATSVVRLAHKWDRSEEKLYAVKEFRKRRKNETEKEYVKKLTAEFCISSTLHHVNIVETVDLVQDENKHWCEVMEFCPGGDLYAAIKKGGMSPSEVECCFKQIMSGVAYLHSQGVAHRDIKPENLFFNSRGQLKIGDYGASTVYRLPWETTVHMSTGLCGSEPYIAPEQFANKPYDARLVDIWACGIVYYCLHFQELPWRVAQNSDPLYAAYAQACSSTSPAQSSCPPTINNLSPRPCRPLIRKMLDPDPKSRWTVEEVIAFPWVQSIEVCHLVEKPTHVHVYARSLAEAQSREAHNREFL